MVKSAVYYENSFLGEAEIIPQNSNTGSWIREIRISHLSPPSERCLPLAILHTVASGGVCFKMESKLPLSNDSPLLSLHASLATENKTAVVPIGEAELHLVAMASKKNPMPVPYFWGFILPSGLYDSSLTMLNLRCLGIVFDLDETLLVANTMRSFEDRIDALQRKINNETDPQRIAGMVTEIQRYQEDKSILKQYAENDQVAENGKIHKVQAEMVPPLSDSHQLITRPVIRLQEKNIILTRVNPSIRDTSVLVRLRPAWEDLRSYLTAKGRKRFEVYVCTMAERDYALEMWRLLDPESNLISSSKLLDRIVCVKSGSRKSLLNVFHDGICHPKMALVIDDRLKVWDEKDQPRVHVVPAFAPYYAPQAETNITIPVLCVARNVACNVRGGFFKEFDEGILPRIGETTYEDEMRDFPVAPDVGNFLISEDDCSTLNINKDQLGYDGTVDTEAERKLKEASCSLQVIQPVVTNFVPMPVSSIPHVLPTFGTTSLGAMQMMVPLPSNQVAQPVTVGRPVGQLTFPEASFQGSPAREEGEVPESELDPDTRRRLLILQHGQDTREPTTTFPLSPPLNVSIPSAHPQGNWFPLEEEINPRQQRRAAKEFSRDSDPARYRKRFKHPSFMQGGESSVPSDRVLPETRRFPMQLNNGGKRVRSNNSPSFNSFQDSFLPVATFYLELIIHAELVISHCSIPSLGGAACAVQSILEAQARPKLVDILRHDVYDTCLYYDCIMRLLEQKDGLEVLNFGLVGMTKLNNIKDGAFKVLNSRPSTVTGDACNGLITWLSGSITGLLLVDSEACGQQVFLLIGSARSEEMPVGQNTSSHKDAQFEHRQATIEQPESPARVLQEIATKCGNKMEFRTTLCDTTELQFAIEVWFVGEKLGDAVGKTRKEALHRAAEISLRHLAEKYLSTGANIAQGDIYKFSESKENGVINDSGSFGFLSCPRNDVVPVESTSEDSRTMDQRSLGTQRPSFVTSLKELCVMEGFSLVFKDESLPSNGAVNKGEVSAQVEIAGQILGRGVGTTWHEAKIQAAEEALGMLKSMLGQFTRKLSSSPSTAFLYLLLGLQETGFAALLGALSTDSIAAASLKSGRIEWHEEDCERPRQLVEARLTSLIYEKSAGSALDLSNVHIIMDEELEGKHKTKAMGITKEVMTFVKNVSMHPKTWLDFSLLADEEESDDFDMSVAQKEHAWIVERLH
ncbi:hypothetical protein ZIOFF_062660 [Zingiber officinale]|uniref:protein-serine/threonine phosphatase n=1 Tax=Zingiber officinale TaxID=94328 RepID=A0A8J5F5D5_ZINOF|nr:hypothetical protein ZIOFF_062660 [Zingiber officinale]